MQVLDSIVVGAGRRIDLCHGDLSDLARSEWFDAVVVSAFDHNYIPTPSSLIGALDRKGVSVEQLASRKELDYTEFFGTWLSGPVRAADPGIGFGRVVCFEPHRVGAPPQVVRSLFTALVPIVADQPEIRSIAMPIIATGNMGYSIDQMLPPILGAAVDALRHGLPIDRIAIVVRSEADAIAAGKVFAATQAREGEYDVFVSYAHEDTHAREQFVDALVDRRPAARVFVDRFEIDLGAAWQRKIFESLDRCRTVIALLSPAYLTSDVCLEEFNIAWMRSRDAKEQILRPLFVSGSELPTYMQSRLYLDCREFDVTKLATAATSVADDLR